jgi:Transposase DDE domain
MFSRTGRKTGIYYIDSTALPVCHNRRIGRHQTFAGLATRGKTSMGWFFGFKLHLVFNHLNEMVAVKLTPGNVHDGAPVEQLTHNLTGKLFGDKGYLGKQRAAALLKRGLVLMTKVRKNMKALPLTLTDKLLLNARNMAETIIGHIKAFSSLNLPKHRAPLNAFLHLLAALTAYQLNPIKPTASCFPFLSLPA